jgi:hypothetical protein
MKDRVKEWADANWMSGEECIEPITVTIGGESWEGIRFQSEGVPCFYLVGELPAGWKQTSAYSILYTYDDKDFYVYHWHSSLSTAFGESPPFGNYFVLSLFQEINGGCPCTREEMTVK